MAQHTAGLTLGKFAPLHLGHQYMIETALQEMDDVTVIIYDSPEVTDIPLPVRAGWIRRIYPHVHVIEAWGGPDATGYTPEIMRAHEEYVLGLLKGKKITHFYSSEPYGDHMSAALGAVDRRVDMERKTYRVSGTMVRQSPDAHRSFLHPEVYKDHVTKVVFLGAPSTGKTTIASHLADAYGTVWMPEYGREFWEAHQEERRLTPEQLVQIAEGHLAREEKLVLKAKDYLFVDTNAITTYMFAQCYHGEALHRLRELAEAAGARYDVVFVCDTDIPYDDTWDRSGDMMRQEFQKQIMADLVVRKIPFHLLSGSLEERIGTVNGILSTFRKYQRRVLQ